MTSINGFKKKLLKKKKTNSNGDTLVVKLSLSRQFSIKVCFEFIN